MFLPTEETWEMTTSGAISPDRWFLARKSKTGGKTIDPSDWNLWISEHCLPDARAVRNIALCIRSIREALHIGPYGASRTSMIFQAGGRHKLVGLSSS